MLHFCRYKQAGKGKKVGTSSKKLYGNISGWQTPDIWFSFFCLGDFMLASSGALRWIYPNYHIPGVLLFVLFWGGILLSWSVETGEEVKHSE
jgi:hypothetical protein